MDYHLAQLNIARLRQPMDHEDSAEFVRALDPINQLAESTPGFVWRLKDDDGASSSYVDVEGIDDPQLIVNMSVWEDLESFSQFVFQSGHTMYLRRRRDWFEKAEDAVAVCWWIPAGSTPEIDDAYQRLLHFRENGPSERAWPLSKPVPPPSE